VLEESKEESKDPVDVAFEPVPEADAQAAAADEEEVKMVAQDMPL